MSNRSSNGRSQIAAASFVFALAAAVGSFERQAFAHDDPAPPKEAKPSTDAKEKKDKDGSDDSKKEGSSELDTSVEAAKAIYLTADLGATRSDLGGLKNNTGFDRTVANGVLWGLGAGVRLKDLRLGVRWNVYDTTEFDMWAISVEAGYGLKLRPLSPVFSVRLGYVFDEKIQEGLIRNSLPAGTYLPPDISLKGLLAGLYVNGSYWVNQFIRVGPFLGVDAMFLNREQAPLPRSTVALPTDIGQNPLYSGSGSSIGLNFNIGIRGSFDIGFK